MALQPYERRIGVVPRRDVNRPNVDPIRGPAGISEIGSELLRNFEPEIRQKRIREGQEAAATAPVTQVDGRDVLPEPERGGTVFREAFRRTAEEIYKSQTVNRVTMQLDAMRNTHRLNPDGFLASSTATIQAVIDAAPDSMKPDLVAALGREQQQRYAAIGYRAAEQVAGNQAGEVRAELDLIGDLLNTNIQALRERGASSEEIDAEILQAQTRAGPLVQALVDQHEAGPNLGSVIMERFGMAGIQPRQFAEMNEAMYGVSRRLFGGEAPPSPDELQAFLFLESGPEDATVRGVTRAEWMALSPYHRNQVEQQARTALSIIGQQQSAALAERTAAAAEALVRNADLARDGVTPNAEQLREQNAAVEAVVANSGGPEAVMEQGVVVEGRRVAFPTFVADFAHRHNSLPPILKDYINDAALGAHTAQAFRAMEELYQVRNQQQAPIGVRLYNQLDANVRGAFDTYMTLRGAGMNEAQARALAERGLKGEIPAQPQLDTELAENYRRLVGEGRFGRPDIEGLSTTELSTRMAHQHLREMGLPVNDHTVREYRELLPVLRAMPGATIDAASLRAAQSTARLWRPNDLGADGVLPFDFPAQYDSFTLEVALGFRHGIDAPREQRLHRKHPGLDLDRRNPDGSRYHVLVPSAGEEPGRPGWGLYDVYFRRSANDVPVPHPDAQFHNIDIGGRVRLMESLRRQREGQRREREDAAGRRAVRRARTRVTNDRARYREPATLSGQD